MSQRILTYTGSGTLRTWLTPDNLSQTIAANLINNGWCVTDINIQYIPSPTAWSIVNPLFLNYYNYAIKVSINALPQENPERVRQALYAYLSDYFEGVSLSLTDDTIQTFNPNTGQATVQDTVQDQRPTWFDDIFGRGTSLTGAGAQVLGISTGTIIVVGLGFLMVQAILNNSNKRR